MLRSPSVSIVHGIEDYINDEVIDDMNRKNNEELHAKEIERIKEIIFRSYMY